MKRVIVRRAMYNEIVEIQWTLEDGSIYWERRTLPPVAVRSARLAVQEPRARECGAREED